MSIVGKTLGRYRLLEEVGSGGFATVYLGLDTQRNEPVAVKVLLDQASRDPTAVARFEREAQALRKLPAHPNIVGLRTSGRIDGYYYLVMDYLAGNDLSTVLNQQGKLPVSEAVDIVVQITDALKAAFAAGLVHRDIKPENIRLVPDGAVKLLDFGIARDAASARLTQEGLLAGTAAYVAPEVWRGQQPDHLSDIYSLGCVFYEMLAGRPPFTSDTLEGTMRMHLETSPDIKQVAAAGTPADVCDAVERMLAKDPRKRPSDDGLLNLLEPYGQAGTYQPPAIPTLTPIGAAEGSQGTARSSAAGAGPGARSGGRTEADETRVNLRTAGPATGRKGPQAQKRPPANATANRQQKSSAGHSAPAGPPRAGLGAAVAIAVIFLVVGLMAGILATSSFGLPAVLDLRAGQMDGTPAAAARTMADWLRGTQAPQTAPAVAAAATTVIPSDALTPTVTATLSPTANPDTIFNFIPGRLRGLPDGRRVDYWIDDSSPGLTLDPPVESESGQNTWVKLDYTDPGDYGPGFVTIRAGVTAHIVWSMDKPLAPGYYELFIYRPYRPPDELVRPFIAITVPYEVRLDDQLLVPFAGSSTINHQDSYGQWVSIGGYELKASGILNVRLDVENALPLRYEVAVDGLAIARLSEPQLTPTQTPAPVTATPTLTATVTGP